MTVLVCAAIHRERRSFALFLCFLSATIANVTSFFLPTTCIPRANKRQIYSSFADDESLNNNKGNKATTSTKRRKKKPRLPEKNLYDILGANQSMSRQDIKRQYITLAKEYHPDSAGPEYVDRFDEIARAWDVLSDTTARRAYDRELAAEKFKDDIVQRANAVANEYGPAARAFYEDFALPFLRRTATTTMAGWSVIADEGERPSYNADGKSNVVASPPPPADLGQTFQRVIEAGRNATRQIDAVELQEKSEELRLRADETRAESLEVLERLSAIKSERLHLTVHTSSADFSSTEALQFLDGFNTLDQQTLMDRMIFRHPITNDIDAFSAAEEDLEQRENEKHELDREVQARREALEEAEHQAQFALMEEERILRLLEEARQNVADTQQMVAETQLSLSSLNPSIRMAEQNLSKAKNFVKRKRDVVRKALKRKEEKDGLATNENSRNRERPFSAFRRSQMSDIGFEKQNLHKIAALRNEENEVEGDFLRLVELTSKLVSRSERLRIRSEELMGRNTSDREMYEEYGNLFPSEEEVFAYDHDLYGQSMQPYVINRDQR
jgi:curved DNA-binding protein CbpA